MIRCLIGCNRLTKILVDEEEQRGDRVDQEREGLVAQGERARPLPQPRLPSRQEVQEHELTHITAAGVYIAYKEQEDPMRIADEQDKMRKKENNT